MKNHYLAKACFISTNLAPYASRLLFSTMFGTTDLAFIFDVEVENRVISIEGRELDKNQHSSSQFVTIQENRHGVH